MSIRIIKGNADDGGFIIKDNHITKREIYSLYLLASGCDNVSGAKRMKIGVNTFRNNVHNTMKKLGATTRAHAVTVAVQNGMLEIERKKPEKFYLCMYCNKVFAWDKVKEKELEPIYINHVKMTPPPRMLCPNKGCNKDALDAVEWDYIVQEHPEYPEIPIRGKVYDFDFEKWHRGL
ncbi:LuxR C-terminal-related transcriptional regulator [Chloroflexota bacterium]